MKQKEALEHLRGYMLALQKYRSTTALDISDLTEEMKANGWPWVFGEKCPLSALSKIVGDVDDGEKLDPMNYYNMMFILYRFSPEILIAMDFLGVHMPDEQPPVSIVAEGWET